MTDYTQVTFRNMAPSPALEEAARARAEQMLKYYDKITHCRIVLESPHHQHHHKGFPIYVSVDIKVPGDELFVKSERQLVHPQEDAHAAVHAAFDAMKRQLQKYYRKRMGHVKHPEVAIKTA